MGQVSNVEGHTCRLVGQFHYSTTLKLFYYIYLVLKMGQVSNVQGHTFRLVGQFHYSTTLKKEAAIAQSPRE